MRRLTYRTCDGCAHLVLSRYAGSGFGDERPKSEILQNTVAHVIGENLNYVLTCTAKITVLTVPTKVYLISHASDPKS